MTWMIKLSNDTVITSDEVTVAHLTLVAQYAGTATWAELDPTQSAQALIAWVAVLEAQVQNVPLDESLLKTMNLSVVDLQNRIRTE